MRDEDPGFVTRRRNTAALGRLAKEGMKESNYLDAIMHAKYAGNPDNWLQAVPPLFTKLLTRAKSAWQRG